MKNLILLAMMLDFMAFTAQTFRRLLSSRSSTLVQLQAIRDIMLMSIHTIDSTRRVVSPLLRPRGYRS